MKIVTGFTGSSESWAALGWAMDRVAKEGGQVSVVTSLTTGQSPATELEHVMAYREALERAEAQLVSARIPYKIRRIAIEGYSPADSIRKVASEDKADLIVIGVRRRSRTGKLLLGSDALDVLADAECPVVCVKAAAEGALPTY